MSILRRIKLAYHGYENRSKAILYIDGHIYDYSSHPTMIEDYLKKINKLNDVIEDFYFGDEQSIEDSIEKQKLPLEMKEYLSEFNRIPISIAIGHLTYNKEGKNIYLDTDFIINCSKDEVIDALKKHYPQTVIYRDRDNKVLYRPDDREENHLQTYKFIFYSISKIDFNKVNKVKLLNYISENLINANLSLPYVDKVNISIVDFLPNLPLKWEIITEETDLTVSKCKGLIIENVRELLKSLSLPGIDLNVMISKIAPRKNAV